MSKKGKRRTNGFKCKKVRKQKKYKGLPKHLRTRKIPKGMDHHHLIPFCICRKTTKNNLVLIKRVKHIALHQSFGNLPIDEILDNFSTLEKKITRENWRIMFGNKTPRQAWLLLDRLWAIKKQIKS